MKSCISVVSANNHLNATHTEHCTDLLDKCLCKYSDLFITPKRKLRNELSFMYSWLEWS